MMYDYGFTPGNNPFSAAAPSNPDMFLRDLNIDYGQTPTEINAPQSGGGNWLDRIGGFARDITPLLYGAGSIIEGIRGVPSNQSRFAGFNQGVQYDMLARSLGYDNGRELIESGQTGRKPPKPGEPGGSVITPSPAETTFGQEEDLSRFIGTPEEGGAVNRDTLGLEAVLRGANEYGMSPREFVERGQEFGYQFGPKALAQIGGALSNQGLNAN
jgi:hypothetical protein